MDQRQGTRFCFTRRKEEPGFVSQKEKEDQKKDKEPGTTNNVVFFLVSC